MEAATAATAATAVAMAALHHKHGFCIRDTAKTFLSRKRQQDVASGVNIVAVI